MKWYIKVKKNGIEKEQKGGSWRNETQKNNDMNSLLSRTQTNKLIQYHSLMLEV